MADHDDDAPLTGEAYELYRDHEGFIAAARAASFDHAVEQFKKTHEFIAGDFVLDPAGHGGHTFDGKDFQWALTPEYQEGWDLQQGRLPDDDHDDPPTGEAYGARHMADQK